MKYILDKFLVENVSGDFPLIIANRLNDHLSLLGENQSRKFLKSSQFQCQLQRRIDYVFFMK